MTQTSLPPSETPPRPVQRWTPRKIAILSVILVVLIAGAGVGWVLISPLFFHNTANDENPFTTTAPSTEATATPAAETTPTTQPTPGSTPTTQPTPSGPVILATGSFHDGEPGHYGTGTVTLGKTADGAYALYMEQLNVTNGPDLYIYLSRHNDPTNASQVTEGGVINLGRLNATEGSVTLDIPADFGASLQEYHSVVVYCQAFSVVFAVAPLQSA